LVNPGPIKHGIMLYMVPHRFNIYPNDFVALALCRGDDFTNLLHAYLA